MISAIRTLNAASNRLYRKLTNKPHYMRRYREMLDEALSGATAVIHLGAGPLWLGDLCTVPLDDKTVYAVDPDEEALSRCPAAHKIVAYGESIPLPDGSVDVITSEHLLEHLRDPAAVLREAHRLLRPGGKFVFTAPNKLSYFGLATAWSPHWFQKAYVKMLRGVKGTHRDAPYPAYYRMSSVGTIQRLARQEGFDVKEIWTGVDHPSYTYPFPIVHQIAVAWHIVLDKVELLAPFRLTLTGTLVRR